MRKVSALAQLLIEQNQLYLLNNNRASVIDLDHSSEEDCDLKKTMMLRDLKIDKAFDTFCNRALKTKDKKLLISLASKNPGRLLAEYENLVEPKRKLKGKSIGSEVSESSKEIASPMKIDGSNVELNEFVISKRKKRENH